MDFSSVNLHNEEKFVSYILRNPKEYTILDFSFLLNTNIKIICKCVEKIVKENLSLTIDEVWHYIKKESDEISKEYLQKIYDEYN